MWKIENNLILTIIGSHAQEDINTIFNRKIEDIDLYGFTYWTFHSYKLDVNDVHNIKPKYCLFLAPKSNCKPTLSNSEAKFFSVDKQKWEDISIKNVTGKMPAKSLVLKSINFIEDLININDFRFNDEEIKFRIGASTILVKKDSLNNINKNNRKIVAIAELKFPYCVWVK